MIPTPLDSSPIWSLYNRAVEERDHLWSNVRALSRTVAHLKAERDANRAVVADAKEIVKWHGSQWSCPRCGYHVSHDLEAL